MVHYIIHIVKASDLWRAWPWGGVNQVVVNLFTLGCNKAAGKQSYFIFESQQLACSANLAKKLAQSLAMINTSVRFYHQFIIVCNANEHV